MTNRITTATVTQQNLDDVAVNLDQNILEALHVVAPCTPGEWLAHALESEHADAVLAAMESAGLDLASDVDLYLVRLASAAHWCDVAVWASNADDALALALEHMDYGRDPEDTEEYEARYCGTSKWEGVRDARILELQRLDIGEVYLLGSGPNG